MQCEKLYNLRSKAYFNCILFACKKAKFCVTNFRRCEKITFFYKNDNSFLLLSPFYHLVCLRKTTKHTTRCSVKSSTIYKVKVMLIV